MPADPEVQAIIDMIDRRIAKLQQTKALLLSEFGGSRGQQRELRLEAPSTPGQPVTLTKGTRKAQVTEFLRQYGPMPRRDIVEKTGLPLGTIAYVLNDEQMFRQSHGKWDIRNREPQNDRNTQ